MKIYIASHCKWAALYVSRILGGAGHQVVSTWHDGPFLGMDHHDAHERADIALRDTNEVSDAEGLVLIAAKHPVRGGKFVEAGIALGLGKTVVVLGERENMLMHHPLIAQVSDISGLLEALAS